MKKIIGLLIGLVAVAILAYFAIDLVDKDGKSDTTELIDFEIKEVEKIDKIDIYDPTFDITFTLVKNGDNWEDKDGNCVQQGPVETILKTFKKVTFKGYVTETLQPRVKSIMAAKAKKVTVYKNGEMDKVWYVGHPTPDHYGTYMLVETPEIKSDNPVIMTMKGFNGILEPRFFARPKQWQCTDLFSFSQQDIKSVSVKNYSTPSESYTVEKIDNKFVATQNSQVLNFNSENLLFYLNGFENIHFNSPNYTLNTKQIDSIKNSTPYVNIHIQTQNGTNFNMNMYQKVDKFKTTADSIVYDNDMLFGIKPDGELVQLQYFVMGPIIDGKSFFVNK